MANPNEKLEEEGLSQAAEAQRRLFKALPDGAQVTMRDRQKLRHQPAPRLVETPHKSANDKLPGASCAVRRQMPQQDARLHSYLEQPRTPVSVE